MNLSMSMCAPNGRLWGEPRFWFSNHHLCLERCPMGRTSVLVFQPSSLLGKMPNGANPELKNKFEIDEVELVLPIPGRGGNDRVNDSRNDTLNDSVKTTYTIIRSNPGIQRKGIADMSGKSVATTSRHLAILVKEGLIEHRDSDKTGGYYAK